MFRSKMGTGLQHKPYTVHFSNIGATQVGQHFLLQYKNLRTCIKTCVVGYYTESLDSLSKQPIH